MGGVFFLFLSWRDDITSDHTFVLKLNFPNKVLLIFFRVRNEMSLVFNLYFNIQSLGQKMFDGERQFLFGYRIYRLNVFESNMHIKKRFKSI